MTSVERLFVVFQLGENHFPYVFGNTCELENLVVHATVLPDFCT